VRATHAAVRALSERVRDDRPLADDIELVASAIADGAIVAAAEAEIGPLQ
jgi:histidine ammonia-lyase